jgi:hypothetical protein
MAMIDMLVLRCPFRQKFDTSFSAMGIRYVAPLIVAGAVWGAFFIYSFFTSDAFKKNELAPIATSSIQQPSKLPQQQNQPKPLPVLPASVESKRYRLVGTTYRDGILHVYVEDGNTKQLVIYASDACKMGGLNGPECEISGQLGTKYTGVHDPKPKASGRQNLLDTVPEVRTD